MATLTIDKSKRWTVDDYTLLDEDLWCEIIDAELIMTPAPGTKHQGISKSLFVRIFNFISGNGQRLFQQVPV